MDSASLRATLLRTDLTPNTIQKSAAAMLSHYDRIPSIAVDDWRQCLTTCRDDQLLPLLYVANEVIQTSKRNRGSRFLEAFSPVLSSSLRLMCERNRSIVEKARRVVKIWGDRRIYSVRFVGEVLDGMSAFREKSGGVTSSEGAGHVQSRTTASTPVKPTKNGTSSSSNIPTSSKVANSTSSDVARTATGKTDQSDDFSFLSESSSPGLLKVEVSDFDRATPPSSARTSKNSKGGTKRKRPSKTLPAAKSVKKKTLLEALDEINELNSQYKLCLGVMNGFPDDFFSADEKTVENIVGDDLGDMYAKVSEAEGTITRQRKRMHGIADAIHGLEKDLVKFIPSLRESVRQDDQDLKLCSDLEDRLKLLLVVHGAARKDRAKKRAEDAKKRAAAEEATKKREEEAERKRELEETMKAREAAPGMVWNPVTKEYQNVHDQTTESWRD